MFLRNLTLPKMTEDLVQREEQNPLTEPLSKRLHITLPNPDLEMVLNHHIALNNHLSLHQEVDQKKGLCLHQDLVVGLTLKLESTAWLSHLQDTLHFLGIKALRDHLKKPREQPREHKINLLLACGLGCRLRGTMERKRIIKEARGFFQARETAQGGAR